MLNGLLVILLLQLAGELLVRLSGLPVPGPVVGLLLLLVLLRTRRPAEDSATVRAAQTLIRHLSLLFVPAGVGVITLLAVLCQQWVAVLGGLVLGWLTAALAAALTAAALLRLTGRREAA